MHLELARVLALHGRDDEAAEQFATGASLMAANVNTIGLSAYAYAYRLAGRPDDARLLFARFEVQAASEVVPDFVPARPSLATMDIETARADLRRIAGAEQVVTRPAGSAIVTNRYNDPIAHRPEFVEVRSAIAERLQLG